MWDGLIFQLLRYYIPQTYMPVLAGIHHKDTISDPFSLFLHSFMYNDLNVLSDVLC